MKKKIVYIGNKLAVHGHNPTTVDTLSVLFAREGYRVVAAATQKNKLWRILNMAATVIRHAKSTDFVIIDTYSTSNFWYAFGISQLCRVLKLRYIPYLHGGDLPERLRKNPLCSRMIFEHSYKNVAPSAYLMHRFRENNIPDLVQLPNIIELDQYEFKRRTVIRPRLFWVRAFAAIYNPEMAVRVAEKLQALYPETELCMVGPDKDGSLEAVKTYAASKGVNVRFTGKLAKKEWTEIAADYDVFISTSRFDNMPVSLMEAMALGMPVVATNVGGIPFLLEDGVEAQLVTDGSVSEMTAAIRKLMDKPEQTQKQIDQAYRKVKKFDWKEIKNQWQLLFED